MPCTWLVVNTKAATWATATCQRARTRQLTRGVSTTQTRVLERDTVLVAASVVSCARLQEVFRLTCGCWPIGSRGGALWSDCSRLPLARCFSVTLQLRTQWFSDAKSSTMLNYWSNLQAHREGDHPLWGPLDHAGRVEELRQSAMPQRVKWQKRWGCMKKDKVTQFLILLQHGYFLLYHYIQENMKRDKGKLSLSTTHNTLFPLLPNIYRWIKGAKEWKDWVCICYPWVKYKYKGENTRSPDSIYSRDVGNNSDITVDRAKQD